MIVTDFKRILLILMATLLPAESFAQWTCQDVFNPDSIHRNEAVEMAVLKSAFKKGPRNLSANDLTRLVHNMFQKYEGKTYQASDYLKLTAAERTKVTLFRQASETVTRRGLEAYFKENGLLVDSSTLLTKLWVINRSKSFNLFSAVGATMSFATGKAPIFLPEVFLEVKPQDMNILILKGLDSKEGLEISNRYGFRQEVIRGYSLANRYYTRVAITVACILIYSNIDEFMSQDHDSISADLWALFLSEIKKYEEKIP